MRLVLFPILMLLVSMSVRGQIQVSVAEGCIPLEVDFGAPPAASYFWDFGDSQTSTDQAPSHIYTSSGSFVVQLFDQPGGALIGDTVIHVYPDPIVNISADPSSGCASLQVDFTSQVIAVDSIDILSYQWTFGDGEVSNDQDPQHVYTQAGTYSIGLQVTTSPGHCSVTKTFDNYITVVSPESFFRLDRTAVCLTPATINILEVIQHEDGNTYLWDFGDGSTSTDYNPGSITYTEEGGFLIRLTVTDELGCTAVYTRQVIIGDPNIKLNLEDSVCLGIPYVFSNVTGTNNSSWNFGENASPQTSTQHNPQVTFNTPGIHTVTLSTWIFQDCKSDTTFDVFVDFADASFDFDPFISCHDPMTIHLEADNPNMATYIWNDTLIGGSVEDIVYQGPVRDSLHINRHDTIPLFLEVRSIVGCVDTLEQFFIQRKPDAYFLANVTKGCAPLQVTFQDSSLSTEPIIRWKWLFGDGTETTSLTDESQTHVYNTPGEYYVRLVIENLEGCIDTSFGVWIQVGEPIIPQYSIDKDEICLGDSITILFVNKDPRIDAWHFDSDNGRFDHCWKSPVATHAFITEPGLFDVDLTIEYNGCYGRLHEEDRIRVNGAKANISYMVNCDAPLDVMLWNRSENDDTFKWTFPEPDSSFLDSLTHHFDTTGNYTIYLEAEEEGTGCPVSVDSVEVFIRQIKADFTLPERVCDNIPYILDASNSVDVDNDCSKGFLWYLPGRRPREVSKDTIHHFFPRGEGEVILIVEDINGCTDTLTHTTTSYGIEADFAMDKEKLCFPAEVSFSDLSVSDTTITEWEWSFGSTDPNTSHVFDEDSTDDLLVTLKLTDELGCMETVTKTIRVYEPVSNISAAPQSTICLGDTAYFMATDFTSEGSFLHFDWSFAGLGSSEEQNPSFYFQETGTYPVILSYTEDASGCTGMDTLDFRVVAIPVAEFSSTFDDASVICWPAQISFVNESVVEGIPSYQWSLGNGVMTTTPNPALTYGKGTYMVRLIARSQFGCSDTISREYVLIGPEGNMVADKMEICKGDEITFSLADTADVSSFTWDFGDGQTLENENPVTYTYTSFPPSGTRVAKLILRSANSDSVCTTIDSLPIGIHEVIADFEFIDTSQYCEGRAQFQDLSTGAIVWDWNFGNGQTSSEQNPLVNYGDIGQFLVTLMVSDPALGCEDTASMDIELAMVPDFLGIANIFTPNHDQIHDYFNLTVLPEFEEFVEVREFRIYNRWGNLIYDNDDPTTGWDGMYKGQEAPAEVYAYFIEYEIRECMTGTFKGNVTLLR